MAILPTLKSARFPIKRTLTEKECLYIYDLMGIDIPQEDQFDSYEDYVEEIQMICLQVIAWILEKSDDDDPMQIVWKEHSPQTKSEISRQIEEYLKKKKAI